MIEVILKLQTSKVYQKLTDLYNNEDYGDDCIARMKLYFFILKRKINEIVDDLRRKMVIDKHRMFFYRVVRKFLPVFVKVWKMI